MSGHCELVGRGPVCVRWTKRGPAGERAERHRAEIDEVWDAELARGVALHDGSVLSPLSVTAGEDEVALAGEYVSYRALIADRRRPDLGLGLGSIAVSGATIVPTSTGDAVLAARRSSRSSSHPDLLELVPAGSLGREVARPDGSVDHAQALLTELAEELGGGAPPVLQIKPLCVIRDPAVNVIDICSVIRLDGGDLDQLLARMADSGEHAEPRLIPLAELDATVARQSEDWTPTSVALAAELSGR